MLTAIVFLLLMFFFDQNDWFVQRERKNKLDDIQQNIEYLTEESEKMQAQLNALNNDTAYLEKYAREHYHEKRDNEDVFLILPDTTTSTTKKQ